jgi:hypothetical protein
MLHAHGPVFCREPEFDHYLFIGSYPGMEQHCASSAYKPPDLLEVFSRLALVQRKLQAL